MKIKMSTVNSNVKLITSNQAPTTSNLAKGEMAFGQVGGVNSIYGNTGNGIIKIEFTAGGEPIIYFEDENALNTFLEGEDVPESGWYAAIADSIYDYEQYGEWAAFKLGSTHLVGESEGSQAYPQMTLLGGSENASSFYQIGQPTSSDTIDAVVFGNYAHTRYFLYLDFDQTPSSNLPWDVIWQFKQADGNYHTLNVMGASGNEIENPTVFTDGHFEGNMQSYTSATAVGGEEDIFVVNAYQALSSLVDANISGYLVVKEIIADGEPTINWDEILALDSGEEPEPTESYVQFDLGSPTPLGDYINSVSFSNRKQVGDYPLGGTWSITAVSGDEYNINLEAGANSGPLKITVDAYIEFFGMPDNNPPKMDISYIAGVETKTNTIEGVYDSGSRKMKWQGSFTIDNTENQTLGCWASIMRYYENDSPTLRGTIKFEAIDG